MFRYKKQNYFVLSSLKKTYMNHTIFGEIFVLRKKKKKKFNEIFKKKRKEKREKYFALHCIKSVYSFAR